MLRLAEGVTAADKSAGRWQMPQPLILYKVTPNTQKAAAAAGGFALVELVVTSVGKRVFLLIDPTITTVMHDMTPAATTVKKAALGRSKSPPLAVKKHLLVFPYFISISIKNTVISFLYRRSRTFFTANGGLFEFAPFQPAIRQAEKGRGGEYPRARSRDIIRHARTHRAKP